MQINSLVDEGLLKKYITKRGDGTDELVSINFKCNFEVSFINDVADKINFILSEYIHGNREQI